MFKSTIKAIKLCDYCNSAELRVFLEEFKDIFDFYLIHLFEKRNECNCNLNKSYGIKNLSLRLIRYNEQTKCTKYEQSKYLYNSQMKEPFDLNKLIFEFNENIDLKATKFYVNGNPIDITFSNTQKEYNKDINLEDDFTEEEIDQCISNIFPIKTTAQAIETRETSISLGRDFVSNEMVEDFSIFSTPEFLIDQLNLLKLKNSSRITVESNNANTISDDINNPHDNISNAHDSMYIMINVLLEFLTSLYKKNECLVIDRNYRYFQYYLFNTVDLVSMEQFFMSSTIYEYLDRMFFSQKYLRFKYTSLLYNIILQYQAFEIEEIHDRKLKESYSIPEHNIQLYIPITSVINIKFTEPKCQNIHYYGYHTFLIGNTNVELSNNDMILLNSQEFKENVSEKEKEVDSKDVKEDSSKETCECKRWIELSKEFNRSNISLQVKQSVTKDIVLNNFYSREPENMFSYSEICLSKAMNTVFNNHNKGMNDDNNMNVMLNLLELGINYPFPPFLYFIHQFADLNENEITEYGVGLRSGTGVENNKSEEVEEEDIMDDYGRC